MNQERKYFGKEDFVDSLNKIIEQINKSNWSPEVIISINRGGCIPGIYLSHRLSLKHKVIDIQLRNSNKPPDLKIIKQRIKEFDNILLVDDINDSGKTLKTIYDLTNAYSKIIYNATLIYNQESKVKTDFYGKEIRRSKDQSWYVFPWEEW
ncbi:MAG: hypothetical protein CBC56_006170 [Flavobacteriales bacterium TMED96]|nr:MAG: hypothetical protein CBC56_006170 [Flavobacteriales bacterium TMED96]|tara:strand:- start:217 stop:669 length:453 start_codon:yes stop_codon:yes gene_type:complete